MKKLAIGVLVLFSIGTEYVMFAQANKLNQNWGQEITSPTKVLPQGSVLGVSTTVPDTHVAPVIPKTQDSTNPVTSPASGTVVQKTPIHVVTPPVAVAPPVVVPPAAVVTTPVVAPVAVVQPVANVNTNSNIVAVLNPKFVSGAASLANGSIGQNNVRIASFNVTINSTEGGNVSNIILATPNAFGPFHNLKIMLNGKIVGNAVSNPSPSNSYSFINNQPLFIPGNTPAVIDVYADIGSGIQTKTVLNAITLSAISVVNGTGRLITSNGLPLVGQSMFFNPATQDSVAAPQPIAPPVAPITPITTNDPKIILTDGALLKGSGSTIYLIFHNQKYGIASTDSFTHLGLAFKNVQTVSDTFIANIPSAGSQ